MLGPGDKTQGSHDSDDKNNMADVVNASTRETLIEGVSNDVIALFTTLALFILAFLWYNKTHRNVSIHPLQQEQVRFAREHLGLENGNDVNTSNDNSTPNLDRNVPRVSQRNVEQCPICLGQPSFLTVTNCGHAFCGNCIITYWRYGRWMGAIQCPVCRQQVTILFMNFSAEDRAQEDHEQVITDINNYNRRFSGEPRPIMDYIRDLPTLLSQLWSELFSVGGLVLMLRLRILLCFLAAILYFISPLDIIPEAVFGILGLTDDFLILLLLLIYVTEMYRRAVATRAAAAGS